MEDPAEWSTGFFLPPPLCVAAENKNLDVARVLLETEVKNT